MSLGLPEGSLQALRGQEQPLWILLAGEVCLDQLRWLERQPLHDEIKEDYSQGKNILLGAELPEREPLWGSKRAREPRCDAVRAQALLVGLPEVDDLHQKARQHQNVVHVQIHVRYFLFVQESEAVGDIGDHNDLCS